MTPARSSAIVAIEELLAELPRHARRCALEAPGYPTGPCNCDGNRAVRGAPKTRCASCAGAPGERAVRRLRRPAAHHPARGLLRPLPPLVRPRERARRHDVGDRRVGRCALSALREGPRSSSGRAGEALHPGSPRVPWAGRPRLVHLQMTRRVVAVYLPAPDGVWCDRLAVVDGCLTTPWAWVTAPRPPWATSPATGHSEGSVQWVRVHGAWIGTSHAHAGDRPRIEERLRRLAMGSPGGLCDPPTVPRGTHPGAREGRPCGHRSR